MCLLLAPCRITNGVGGLILLFFCTLVAFAGAMNGVYMCLCLILDKKTAFRPSLSLGLLHILIDGLPCSGLVQCMISYNIVKIA